MVGQLQSFGVVRTARNTGSCIRSKLNQWMPITIALRVGTGLRSMSATQVLFMSCRGSTRRYSSVGFVRSSLVRDFLRPWTRWKRSPQTAAASRQAHKSHSQRCENRVAYSARLGPDHAIWWRVQCLKSESSALPSVARLANSQAVCSRLIRGVRHQYSDGTFSYIGIVCRGRAEPLRSSWRCC